MEKISYLLHIDTDEIREFFKPIGYNGENSDIFQKPASKGFSKLFDFAIKKSFSIILDSNLSSISKASENIDRLSSFTTLWLPSFINIKAIA